MKLARKGPVAYAVAVGSSLAALLVTAALEPRLAHLSPFFLFYAAVALSSWWGGTGPGLLCTALGASTATYFLLAPLHSFAIESTALQVRLLLFVLLGVLVSSLNGALHRARDRAEAEAASARRSEARAKRLADSNLIGVFFCSIDGAVTGANDRFLKLLGYAREELLAGKVGWLELTSPEHRERDRRAVEELKAYQVCTPFEKDYLLSDGRRVPVFIGCAAVENSLHDCVGFVLNLTEQKRVEAELVAHRERLQAMASELMLAEERERRRIASVLHDSVGQTLAAAKRQVHDVRDQGGGDGTVARLSDAYDLIDCAISTTRTLTSEISPPVLYELGLSPALQWLADRAQRQHGMVCEFHDDGLPKPVGHEVRLVLFQAARELLVNVAKHAHARSCRISMTDGDGKVRVAVQDDGVGFDTSVLGKGGGKDNAFGLFSIRERLSHLGGKVEIMSEPGKGTTVRLSAPLHDMKGKS